MKNIFEPYGRNNDDSETLGIIANGNYIIAYYYRGVVFLKSTDDHSHRCISHRCIEDLKSELKSAINKVNLPC